MPRRNTVSPPKVFPCYRVILEEQRLSDKSEQHTYLERAQSLDHLIFQVFLASVHASNDHGSSSSSRVDIVGLNHLLPVHTCITLSIGHRNLLAEPTSCLSLAA